MSWIIAEVSAYADSQNRGSSVTIRQHGNLRRSPCEVSNLFYRGTAWFAVKRP
jgi:hypothetical protein